MPARWPAASSSCPTATCITSGTWSAAIPTSSPAFPTPASVVGYAEAAPAPEKLTAETVGDAYIVLTQRPTYRSEAAWQNKAERPGFISTHKLCFLRPYQQQAIRALQVAAQKGSDRLSL